MNVVAVVVAGGRTGELDVLTPIAGVSMLEHSLRCLFDAGVPGRVQLLLGRFAERQAVVDACAELPVDVLVDDARLRVGAHADQRASRTDGDGLLTVRSSDVLIIHDAARPLAPPSLVTAVLDAVRAGHDAAVPVLRLADTVKVVDAEGTVRATPDRDGLRVVQTPRAFRGSALAGLASVADVLAHGGHRTVIHTVPGDPRAFAVRSGWDLRLAELLAGRMAP